MATPIDVQGTNLLGTFNLGHCWEDEDLDWREIEETKTLCADWWAGRVAINTLDRLGPGRKENYYWVA